MLIVARIDTTVCSGNYRFRLLMKSKLPTSDDLIKCICIFNSHEDFSVYEAIYVDYDDCLNLIIMCEHTDNDKPKFYCATYAILNKLEATRLSRLLKVSLLNLPLEIADAMAEWNDIVCPLPSDVRDCFKETTECLLDKGCRFCISSKFSTNGLVNQ